MMIFLWLYGVTGTLYFFMYMGGASVVVKYAVGPFWALMMAAPIILAVLVFGSIIVRLFPYLDMDKR